MFSQTSEKYEDEETITGVKNTYYTFLNVRYELKEDLKNLEEFIHIGAGSLFDLIYVVEIKAPKKGSLSLKLQKKIMKILKRLWEES
jgi:hypothetical protein